MLFCSTRFGVYMNTISQPKHLPTATFIQSLPSPTPENPLILMFSACFGGTLCGYDGTSNGIAPTMRSLMAYPNVKPVFFCPEDYSFGTPRELCDIHGGNGFDVLDGKARVLTETNKDWTDLLVTAAQKMAEKAEQNKVQIAVLLDTSASCGTQVIYNGSRLSENKIYQKGPGVAAAALIRKGVHVISQRDYKTLSMIFSKIDPAFIVPDGVRDHHETEWYQGYFAIA